MAHSKPLHGGNLQDAIDQYGGRGEQWLDLSTGISPYAWPVEQHLSQVPQSCWHHLPEREYLQQSAAVWADYYRFLIADLKPEQVVLSAGSQALIQQLPVFFSGQIFQRSITDLQVWTLAGSYGEHVYQWQQSGAQVKEKSLDELNHLLLRLKYNEAVDLPDILILINPDNPSGQCWSHQQIALLQQKLSANYGWLILDAAFAEVSNNQPLQLRDNTLVLTSVGKFFGLAGLRIGAAFIGEQYCDVLKQRLGPWPVSGLSLWLATQALSDTSWQMKNRQKLQRIHRLMLEACAELPVVGSSDLFITLEHPNVEQWQQKMVQQKIWTRCFKEQKRLRIGMPEFNRFEKVRTVLKQLDITKYK
ncbi:aminotransferase class I/II-fold pyridoxal phosphate-dependent enzyme [Bacterioplanoides sp.]|uniref:aminotransferase class I/II-fold pyridoxal phosphate-dependent enzyme n=1 Tax=Bacterioplanoides sp. TaxID=2066072 RepID=UPI003B000C2E